MKVSKNPLRLSSTRHNASKKVEFIPHVEGLRGVAVLAVLLYHFEASFVRGGYVGVDMFFTISGFLITSILLKSNGNLRELGSFFKKRFFRLYPASAVTVIISLTGSHLTFPNDLAFLVSRSALYSQLLVSNVYFHANTNYFDEVSLAKPLLHLWSLSVEEQFYIVWAPFVILILKNLQNINTALYVLFLIATASFHHAGIHQNSHPSYIFFELPPRIYQFTIGAMTALVSMQLKKQELNEISNTDHFSHRDSKVKRNTGSNRSSVASSGFFYGINMFSVLCFLTLLLSFYWLPLEAPPHMILPTSLSTAILIALPERTLISRMLSLKPIRLIGKISYSTYLIHWPLYVFGAAIFRAVDQEKSLNPFILTVCSLFLGNLMFWYIESPFRSINFSRRLPYVLLLMISTFSIAAIGICTDGFSYREGTHDAKTFRQSWMGHTNPCTAMDEKDRNHRGGVREFLCGSKLRETMKNYTPSLHGVGRVDQEQDVVLFGNSYVAMWSYAFGFIGLERGISFRMFLLVGCPFVAQNAIDKIPAKCEQGMTFMWKRIRSLPRGTFVGLSFPFYRTKIFSKRYEPIITDMLDMKLRPFVISTPPGLAVENLSKFSCIDMSRMWIRRILFSHSEKDAPKHCIDDVITNGSKICTIHDRIQAYILPKELCEKHGVPYFDVFRHLCNFNFNSTKPSPSEFSVMRCAVPANFSYGHYDLGYSRDLHHLSPFGAFSLRQLMEKRMMDIGALPIEK